MSAAASAAALFCVRLFSLFDAAVRSATIHPPQPVGHNRYKSFIL
jgi:hypothetical protein